jgi:hypothetical protein
MMMMMMMMIMLMIVPINQYKQEIHEVPETAASNPNESAIEEEEELSCFTTARLSLRAVVDDEEECCNDDFTPCSRIFCSFAINR